MFSVFQILFNILLNNMLEMGTDVEWPDTKRAMSWKQYKKTCEYKKIMIKSFFDNPIRYIRNVRNNKKINNFYYK